MKGNTKRYRWNPPVVSTHTAIPYPQTPTFIWTLVHILVFQMTFKKHIIFVKSIWFSSNKQLLNVLTKISMHLVIIMAAWILLCIMISIKVIQNTTMCTWVQITVGGAGVRHGSVNGNYSCSHFNDGDVSCIHVMIFLHLLRSSQLKEISTGGSCWKRGGDRSKKDFKGIVIKVGFI